MWKLYIIIDSSVCFSNALMNLHKEQAQGNQENAMLENLNADIEANMQPIENLQKDLEDNEIKKWRTWWKRIWISYWRNGW